MDFKDLEDKGVVLERTLRGEDGETPNSSFHPPPSPLRICVFFIQFWKVNLDQKHLLLFKKKAASESLIR